MRVLILGGHGFVGKNVTNVLNETNHKIYPLSKRDGLDLTDFENAKEHFDKYKPDIIVNCAAKVGSLNYVTKQAADVLDINMRMLLNIYKGIQNVIPQSILINPIANCAYPGYLHEYYEDKFWDGRVHQSVLAYGSTRRMIDVLSDCYKMQYGYNSINLIVPNMYGPFDTTDPNKAHALNALVSKIVKAKKENRNKFEVWGSGIAIREWLFVKDFAGIVKRTITDLKTYGLSEPINIAQNFGLSVRELVEIILSGTKYNGEIIWNRNMPDGAQRKVMNDSRFKKIFPDFKFTELEKGIKETIEYYESIYPY
jgi:GDP-L-fucose synthase